MYLVDSCLILLTFSYFTAVDFFFLFHFFTTKREFELIIVTLVRTKAINNNNNKYEKLYLRNKKILTINQIKICVYI